MRATTTRRALGAFSVAGAVAAPGLAVASDAAGHGERARAALAGLQEQVRRGLAEWHVPGAAVGVVVGDEVVFRQGFGVRDVAGGAVDADTVFQIGSTTKAFTAATLAILADRGTLRWTDRVLDHDPAFRLYDPWVTRELQILDLLAQRSGLRAYLLDPLAMLGYSQDDAVAALRHVPPVTSFRSTFAYQNILHLVAGRIVAGHLGVAQWEDALQELILGPLGMSATSTSAAGLADSPNHAAGHVWYGDRLRRVEVMPEFYAVGPAGNINAPLADMLTWLRMQTGRGVLDGHRLVSEQNLTETWHPRVALGIPGFPDAWAGYANGWIYHVTPGGRIIWHNGGTGLFKAHVGFIPEGRVGFVMLTNEGNNALADATAMWFYDRVLGNPEVDHNARGLKQAAEARAQADAALRRPSPPTLSGRLGDYAGRYASPVLKAAHIASAGDGLVLTLEAIGRSFPLTPWNGDTFALGAEERALAELLASSDPMLLRFARGPDGGVNELHFVGEPELLLTRAT